jgi:hypothetical protein
MKKPGLRISTSFILLVSSLVLLFIHFGNTRSVVINGNTSEPQIHSPPSDSPDEAESLCEAEVISNQKRHVPIISPTPRFLARKLNGKIICRILDDHTGNVIKDGVVFYNFVEYDWENWIKTAYRNGCNDINDSRLHGNNVRNIKLAKTLLSLTHIEDKTELGNQVSALLWNKQSEKKVEPDRDGVFVIDVKREGKYQILARLSTNSIAVSKRVYLNITIEQPEREVDVFLSTRSVSISGRLYDASGNGIEYPEVRIMSAKRVFAGNNISRFFKKVKGDKDGFYTIDGISPGIFQIRAFKRPFASSAIRIAVEDDYNLDLYFDEYFEITIRVLDVDGKPTSGSSVKWEISNIETDIPSCMNSGKTDSQGSLKIKGLKKGEWLSVFAAHDGMYGKIQVQCIEHKEISIVLDNAIESTGNGVIEGSIMMEDGNLVKAEIFLTKKSGIVSAKTDLNGRFKFEGLEYREYKLKIVPCNSALSKGVRIKNIRVSPDEVGLVVKLEVK